MFQVKAIDGDTIRAVHCPTRFSCPELDKTSRSVARQTMSIRIYAVDCPEIQKRQSDPPSQPYGDEAKEFTSSRLLGDKVKIKLLRKDQYGRAIAKVEYGRQMLPPFAKRDLSMELLNEGLASIYTGGGAEYDGKKDEFERVQQRAKARHRGIWSLGDDMVSPAEFKRQQKQMKQATAGMAF